MADLNPPPTLDDTIEQYIGKFGWKQFIQSTIISFAWFFDAQQTFITVFTDREPKWSCNNSTLLLHNKSCKNNNNTNFCQLPKNAWSWDLPAHTSTVSEWSLECAGPFIRGLPASSFLLGCLVGGLVLATLADSNVGRKNMLVLSCLIMSISGGLTAISKNVWMYVGLRFMSGFGRSTIGTCALVLGSELVGKKWRGKIGMFGLICATLGFLSLPAIAFLLKGSSWRLFYVYTCCPCVCYSFLVYLLVNESPRWLFIKGRREEFVTTLRSLTSSRNILMENLHVSCIDLNEKSQEHHFYSALKILFKKNWAFKRLLSIMLSGFGIGMAYYGMPLGLGNLSFNLYLSVALNALCESLSSLILFSVIGILKKKITVMGLCLVSGICNVTSVLVTLKGLQIGLELLSFFSICTAFNVLLIYTTELFPTCVRNSAVSMMREATLLGGFLGPVLVAVGRKNELLCYGVFGVTVLVRKNELLCYGVFGVTVLVCGVFVVWLPETKGRVLCDTMEEEEGNDGEVNNSVKLCLKT